MRSATFVPAVSLALVFAANGQRPIDLTHQQDCGPEAVVIGTGNPATLAAIVGESLPQPIGGYKICQSFTMDAFYGRVNWGDGNEGPVTPGDFQRQDNGRLLADHTYLKGGDYPVFVKTKAHCRDASPRGEWIATSCGRGTAKVYEGSVISSLTFLPNSLRGGTRATANVVTLDRATGLGILIRISSDSPIAQVPPYVVLAVRNNSVSFDINTSAVNSPANVRITVKSGAGSITQSLTVVP